MFRCKIVYLYIFKGCLLKRCNPLLQALIDVFIYFLRSRSVHIRDKSRRNRERCVTEDDTSLFTTDNSVANSNSANGRTLALRLTVAIFNYIMILIYYITLCRKENFHKITSYEKCHRFE